MLNLSPSLEESSDVFTYFFAQGLLEPDEVRRLYETRPRRPERIVRDEVTHEKQYAMNLLNLVYDRRPCADGLTPEWQELVDDLLGDEFIDWLEAGTRLDLRHLETDIGMYTHEDGDFISVHKDKPNKALTAILYLNEQWPDDAGGHYEVRRSADPDEPPVRTIPPRAGQFLAFPPTERSWHAVTPVRTQMTRLTVQLELWFDRSR